MFRILTIGLRMMAQRGCSGMSLIRCKVEWGQNLVERDEPLDKLATVKQEKYAGFPGSVSYPM